MARFSGFFIALVVLAVLLLSDALFTVHQTEQALVLRFGQPKREITEPGLNIKLPFIERIARMERRVLNLDPPSEEMLLDEQKRVVVDVIARYRIARPLLFFQKMRDEAKATALLNNEINSSLRGILGNVTLEVLLSAKRNDVMERIRSQVNRNISGYGIDIVDVRIGRVDLPKQTSEAIYRRMRSERERDAAEARAEGQRDALKTRSEADRKYTIMLADAEKQAQELRGEGDRTAIRIYAEAMSKDPSFYDFYRSLEAYRKSLADKDTLFVLPPQGPFFAPFHKGAPQ
ncbi:MAG: protease modulator HflC [Pseudomonadota bacterium]|nr:protease modulator HflC [Pseudomonadota bacterium]